MLAGHRHGAIDVGVTSRLLQSVNIAKVPAAEVHRVLAVAGMTVRPVTERHHFSFVATLAVQPNALPRVAQPKS